MNEQKANELPEVLVVQDIIDFLDISKTAAYDLVKSGEFHVVKIGRTFKIPRSAFLGWWNGKTIS
ncbi:hypothetical protein VE23_25135 [Paenibacillus sp. D9]|uniref:helix-turn-helix domain-containing protein n=1 Tax=Paenibacillus sp. D9 TaxID=665792 RepID=UPI00061E261E|nr:helix-turn-helix domain-containing protein [Paenibacillus sp. D9]KKC49575.1 hypothetical protein VE23_25135 [Paenibacillus sp. D9]